MSAKIKKKSLESKIELMEKEIVYFKGKQKKRAMRAYRKLIRSQLRESLYLERSD